MQLTTLSALTPRFSVLGSLSSYLSYITIKGCFLLGPSTMLPWKQKPLLLGTHQHLAKHDLETIQPCKDSFLQHHVEQPGHMKPELLCALPLQEPWVWVEWWLQSTLLLALGWGKYDGTYDLVELFTLKRVVGQLWWQAMTLWSSSHWRGLLGNYEGTYDLVELYGNHIPLCTWWPWWPELHS